MESPSKKTHSAKALPSIHQNHGDDPLFVFCTPFVTMKVSIQQQITLLNQKSETAFNPGEMNQQKHPFLTICQGISEPFTVRERIRNKWRPIQEPIIILYTV